MDIDRPAHGIAEAEITICAPLETVWRIHTDINRWSEWNPRVQRSGLEGPLTPGSTFRWRSGGASIVSTIQEIEPMRRIAWTGRAMGARAAHVWTFERQGNAVAVRTRESFDGWWARLLPDLTRRILENILQSWLQSLKRRAEGQ